MPTLRQVSVPLAGLALLAALAGCAGNPATTSSRASAAPTAGTSPAPTPDTTAPSQTPGAGPTVTLVRTGGFAGVWQQVQVAPDGSWSYLARPQHFPTRGRLTATQRDRLSVLAQALSGAGGSASTGACPDGYRYTVTAGTVALSATDCDLRAHPALAALVEFLVAATPM